MRSGIGFERGKPSSFLRSKRNYLTVFGGTCSPGLLWSTMAPHPFLAMPAPTNKKHA